jgi:uncharacterized protein (TIGR02284 family)
MKRSFALVFALVLLGSGAAQAASPEGPDANQAQPAPPSTEPGAIEQDSRQSTQGAEAERPASQGLDVDALNKLLKNELASVERYGQALDKFRPQGDHQRLDIYQQLSAIQEDHRDAVAKLKTQVQQAGGTPAESSGAGGIWAKVIMGSAWLLGDKTALEALKQGEQSAAEEYQEVLQRQDPPSEASSLIQPTLLPRQSTHIAELDSMI